MPKSFHYCRINLIISFCLVCSAIYVYIYFACLFVCIQINVKTAEPIGTKFCVGHQLTPGKVYEWSKFLKICFENPQFILENTQTFLFLFYNVYKEKMFTIEIEDAREASLKPKWLKFLKKQSTLLDLNFRIDVSQPEDTEWKLDIKVYFTNNF